MNPKKILTLFLATFCTFAPVTASAASVNIDRQPLQMDVSPTVINGRTMVPMRTIFESLGATVTWDASAKSITAQKDTKTILLYLNEPTAFINGVSHTLDAPAVASNGRTMVPVRFIAESLDCQVYWDEDTKLVSIFTDDTEAAAYAVAQKQQQEAKKVEEERIAAQAKEQIESSTPSSAQAHTVYVTATGKKYHYNPSCNGGTYYASTLEKALASGLTPCKKCVK